MNARESAVGLGVLHTAILIITDGQLHAFQRFSSSELVLKTVESCFVALNYYENCRYDILCKFASHSAVQNLKFQNSNYYENDGKLGYMHRDVKSA